VAFTVGDLLNHAYFEWEVEDDLGDAVRIGKMERASAAHGEVRQREKASVGEACGGALWRQPMVAQRPNKGHSEVPV